MIGCFRIPGEIERQEGAGRIGRSIALRGMCPVNHIKLTGFGTDDIRRADQVMSYISGSSASDMSIPVKLLDFGCGNGGFLRNMMHCKGVQISCCGVEWKEIARDYMNQEGIPCKKNIEEYESYFEQIEKGETPRNKYGWEVEMTAEEVQKNIEYWLDRLEARLDELGFYQDCLDNLGGVAFSRDNIKPGYIVQVRYGAGEVISTGPKNCVVKTGDFPLTYAYAEILKVLKAEETAPEMHPYKVGETFQTERWNEETRKIETVEYKVIKTTDKTVTLQAGEEKPITRKPGRKAWGAREWYLKVTDLSRGTWCKPAEQKEERPKEQKEELPALTPEEFAATIE